MRNWEKKESVKTEGPGRYWWRVQFCCAGGAGWGRGGREEGGEGGGPSQDRTWDQVISIEQSEHAGAELMCNYNRSEEEFFLIFANTHTIWHVQQRISCKETNTIKSDGGLDEKHGWIMEQHHKQQWMSQTNQSVTTVRVSNSRLQSHSPSTMSGALPCRMTPPVHSDLEVMEAAERSSRNLQRPKQDNTRIRNKDNRQMSWPCVLLGFLWLIFLISNYITLAEGLESF